MADTNYTDYFAPPVKAAWLNDVNAAIYRAIGTGAGGSAPATPAAVLTNLGLSGSSGSSLVGYLPVGTGAVVTTEQAKAREVVSLLDFMTPAQRADILARTQLQDSTSGLQLAMNTGANCFAPDGTYLVNANGVSIANGNKRLFGNHASAAIWKLYQDVVNTGPGAGSILYCPSFSNFEIEGITFDWNGRTQSVAGPSIACLNIAGCTDWKVKKCRFIGWTTRGLYTNTVQRFEIAENYFLRSTTSGFNNESIDIAIAANDGSVHDNWMLNSALSFVGNRIKLSSNFIVGFGFGAGITGQTSAITYNNIISGNIITGGTGLDENGFSPAGIENWGKNSVISDNVLFSNAGLGIEHGARNSVVSGNVCFDNGVGQGVGVGAGIRIRGQNATDNCTGSMVIGNRCFDSLGLGGGGTQGYGIISLNAENAFIDDVQILNNSLGGNEITPFSLQGGTNLVVEGNTPKLAFTNLTGATPSVARSDTNIFTMSQVGATNVTDFTDGIVGKIYTVRATDANSTLVNSAGLSLQGGVNFAMGSGAFISLLRYSASQWQEIGRRTP